MNFQMWIERFELCERTAIMGKGVHYLLLLMNMSSEENLRECSNETRSGRDSEIGEDSLVSET